MSAYDDHLRRLWELCWGITSLRDAHRRGVVIGRLQDRDYLIDPVKTGADMADARAFFLACADEPGALRAALHEFEHFEGESESLREAQRFIDRVVPGDFLTLRERWTLEDKMRRLATRQDLDRYYRLTMGEMAEEFPVNADALLHKLEERPQSFRDNGRSGYRPRIHPLLVLLELLRTEYPGTELDDPSLPERVAARIGSHQFELLRKAREKRTSPAEPTPRELSLIIQLDPHGVERSQYLVTAWLRCAGLDGPDAKQLRVGDPDETLTLDEVRKRLGDLFNVALRHAMDTESEELIVEFILPREILSEGVHQWLTEASDHRSVLGKNHIVVVRDLQRLRLPSAEYLWRKRWRHVQGGRHNACPALWIDCTKAADVDLDDALLKLTLIALGLSSRPDGQDSALSVALNAGIPIALWRPVQCDRHAPADAPPANESCEGSRFKEEIHHLLADADLHELPKRVHEARRRDLVTGGRWRDLTLLWDDPTRLPYRPTLRAPN